MEFIATIIWAASAVCFVAFMGIIWNYAETADKGS
jgi:hypothetical protein